MFKPELWQSHNEYRTIVTKIGRRLSRNNPKYSFDSYEEERQKLINLNLDPLVQFIKDFYSTVNVMNLRGKRYDRRLKMQNCG